MLLYIMLAYLMPFTALSNAVCAMLAYFFIYFAIQFGAVIIYTNALYFHAMSLGY